MKKILFVIVPLLVFSLEAGRRKSSGASSDSLGTDSSGRPVIARVSSGQLLSALIARDQESEIERELHQGDVLRLSSEFSLPMLERFECEDPELVISLEDSFVSLGDRRSSMTFLRIHKDKKK